MCFFLICHAATLWCWQDFFTAHGKQNPELLVNSWEQPEIAYSCLTYSVIQMDTGYKSFKIALGILNEEYVADVSNTSSRNIYHTHLLHPISI